MIESVKITSGYAKSLSALKGRIAFSPGLNILFGPNGCGKTSLIKIAGAYCGCKAGWSCFVDANNVPFGEKDKPLAYPALFRKLSPGECDADVAWDGTPSFLYLAETNDQMPLSFASEDLSPDGLMSDVEAISFRFSKPSSGQQRVAFLNLLIEAVRKPPCLTDCEELAKRKGHSFKGINDVWQGMISSFAKYVKKLPAKGPMTILLDEPDRNLSIPYQITLWKALPRMAEKLQVIVATHSPFALFCDANFVEMEKGYVELCRRDMAAYMEKPCSKTN